VTSQQCVCHITISMLWSNTAYWVKLSGEDLSRYSNKIESVGLRKCTHYHYLIATTISISQSLPHITAEKKQLT